MFDRLFGDDDREQRLAELEAELEDCERRLEAESERRADAQSARQEAERRANRLEDRVTELEDRVERLQGDEQSLAFDREVDLRGAELAEVLDRLDSFASEQEGILTAAVADDGSLPTELRGGFGERAALVRRAAPCVAVADDAGLLGACLRAPVAPDPFATWDDHVAIERGWFEPTGPHTVALVRSDLFAMGEYDGRERVAFHGFDADLKEQHSKGGFSQSRFERLRDQQIDSHLERCRVALEARETDTCYLVGERSVLHQLADLADVIQAVDATGDPEPALDDAVREFWTVKLRTL